MDKESLQVVKQIDWLDLPQDILFFIFSKLNTFDILIHAQFVCSSWQKLANHPQVFSTINLPMNNYIRNLVIGSVSAWYTRLGKEAVDRSCGELVEFCIEHYCTDELLHYVTDKSKTLRSLRLVSCYNLLHIPSAFASKHTFLEELQIDLWNMSEKVLKDVGRSCSHLKRLIISCEPCTHYKPSMKYRPLPHIIAENMPQLLVLHLSKVNLTKDGLLAILDRCTNLESLDIGNCHLIKVDIGLLGKCIGRIKEFRPPDKYKFDLTTKGF